ncbi:MULTISPECIES: LysR family transcriptional regulator [unclassified Leisingera]|uniref:LysR family transcriptional regulator n=1 Tax=unclassified Leisingera TaxID=2614906 RepID=UPI0010101D22|nr:MULTISPECIES: LysR family transcriptional regulator [unclassified Leisingera]MCF6433432.1 LysR family transcriptional regulator [Leisingera sp. MMG026]QAX32411.1 LysR family transcriptional regulator [Leisingera sp. NJS204]UWQ77491.1 LysR family transcriptional regulator [Leisingera sp. M658]
MDINLVRTFLEVAATGSFVNASERLFVTQSAVSLRVQRLEDALGKPLFTRSKAGAELTSAGREFERYALSLIKIWEEARQQVGVPEGYTKSLTVGAQYSLWPRLGFRWIDIMQQEMPTLNIRAELGMPDRIMRFLIEGVVQIGLMYNPQLRPGLSAHKVIEEDLVLAASWPATFEEIVPHYVFVDWGPEFVHAHALELPDLTNPGLTLSLGAMAADYIVSRQAAAYLPARYIKKYLDEGRLHLVPDAPMFPYPVWSIWRDDLDPEVRATAEATLVAIQSQIDADQNAVLAELCDISANHTVEVLGNIEDEHSHE